MSASFKFTALLATALATVALQACSDNTAELASPGNTGSNPPLPNPPAPPPPPPPPPPPAGPCVTGTTAVLVGNQTHCRISGVITGALSLPAGAIYQLDGVVQVGRDLGGGATPLATGAAGTLTIAPGVTIYARTLDSLLIVTRGSRIVADGNASAPIIFTSAQDAGFAAALGLTNQRAPFTGPATSDPFQREWGGLIINGRAPINFCSSGQSPTSQTAPCETSGEGGSGLYGGAFTADNSGILRYVQIRYSGNPISQTNELNGIALQGVGNGTLMDFIQVHNAADDGIEFFGGSVNVRHAVVTGADDDSFDWVGGWNGRLQFGLAIQNPNQPGTDQGIEADNTSSDNSTFNDVNAQPRSNPILSNITLIGAVTTNTNQRNGILLRRGTDGRIANTVITGFVGAGLDVDDQITYDRITNNTLIVQNTYNANTPALRNDTATTGNGAPPDAGILAAFFNTAGRNNTNGNPSLAGFVNGSAENAAPSVDPTTLDPFFQAGNFAGAVRDAATNFTLGWTFGVNANPTCPAGTIAEANGSQCVLTGTISTNVRLVASPTLRYILRGRVQIGTDVGGVNGVTAQGGVPAILTVDPGVTVEAESLDSLLVVSRGSQLRANGTRTAPVVFTAINPATRNQNTDTRLWGGIVINGRAPINFCSAGQTVTTAPVCETLGEGGSGLYGGNIPGDNSGNLFFTRVEYSGNPISQTNELNGIAFQGVGNGTQIDFLQVHNAADDGIEFFGGTVDARHLVITGADDDSIDWVGGWSGRVQYAVVVQNASQAGTDQGIEADNTSSDNSTFNDVNAQPRSNPILSNITLVGASVTNTNQRNGVLLRRGTDGRLLNTVVTGFLGAGLDLDDQVTYDRTASGVVTSTAGLVVASMFNANTPALRSDTATTGNGAPPDAGILDAFFNTAGRNNVTGTSSLVGLTGTSLRRYINGANETAAAITSPGNSFFKANTYVGAVPSVANNFTTGWTIWLNN